MIRFGLLLLALGMVACSNGDEAAPTVGADGKALKVYRHSLDGAPTNLDPVQAATIYSNFVVVNTYDTLYSYQYLARPYVLKPNLATALPEVSDDGLVYTIRIKPGVHFIDDPAFANGKGRELVAADVVYSLQRHFDPKNRSQGAWLWSGRIKGMAQWAEAGADYDKAVAGLRAVDSHSLRIELIEPYPQLVYTLALGFSGVVAREAVEKYGRELSIHPVGSGPFAMQRFDTAKAVLVANPNFREEPLNLAQEGYDPARHEALGLKALDGRAPPFIDRLEIDFIAETAARWNSFNKGNEIQYTNVPVEHTSSVLASKNPLRLKDEWADKYHWTAGVEAGFIYTGFNLDRPQIGYNPDPQRQQRNHALRCAIRSAYDWAATNDRFYSGIGVVFPGAIVPSSPEFDSAISRASVSRDLAAGKALLNANGWTAENLPELSYGFTNSVTQRQIFEQFRGFMVDLGYPSAKIKPESFATFGDFNKAVKSSQLDIISQGWLLDYPDAENTLQLFYGPNHVPGSNNFNYANPAFDALYARSSTMQPGPDRTALYRQMNQMVIDDCVTVGGLSRNRIYLWHKGVTGLADREILGGFWLRYVDVM